MIISILKIIFGTLAIALLAQVEIELPLNGANIPITGQSFAVLTVGFLLGKQDGISAVLLYLLLGALGWPVFAGGASGTAVFTGGTGGYLIGFIFGAAFTGWARERQWDRNLGKALLAMTIGTGIIVGFGVARLTQLYDFPRALEYGFYPVLGGALVKVLVGALLVWGIRRSGIHKVF